MAGMIAERKLESLMRCIARVRDRCPPGVEDLMRDIDAQDILSLNLTRAVQLCVDIGAQRLSQTSGATPGTMGQTFTELSAQGIIPADLAERMRRAVGFRNVAIHEYDEIDWQIVHAIATRHLTDFEAFARVMACDLTD